MKIVSISIVIWALNLSCGRYKTFTPLYVPANSSGKGTRTTLFKIFTRNSLAYLTKFHLVLFSPEKGRLPIILCTLITYRGTFPILFLWFLNDICPYLLPNAVDIIGIQFPLKPNLDKPWKPKNRSPRTASLPMSEAEGRLDSSEEEGRNKSGWQASIFPLDLLILGPPSKTDEGFSQVKQS